jgi:hypothetical protein
LSSGRGSVKRKPQGNGPPTCSLRRRTTLMNMNIVRRRRREEVVEVHYMDRMNEEEGGVTLHSVMVSG